MLRSTKEIIGYRIHAADGAIGHVKDFYFDDHSWSVRYAVVDTGKWLPGRLVLVAPVEIGRPDWASQELTVNLTRQQIQDAPSIDSELPVSRQHEAALSQYYGWTPYWSSFAGLMEGGLTMPTQAVAVEEPKTKQVDPNLRSARDVIGYHIAAVDGHIGHVADFVADTDGWIIRYLVVDTRNWLPGRKVLVAPSWVLKVDWDSSQVFVDLTRDAITKGPPYDPANPVNRQYETTLYDFYGRPKYW